MGLVDKFKGGKGLASLAKIGTGLLAVGLGFASYAMANDVGKEKADGSKNVPQVSQISQARVETKGEEIFYGRLDAYLAKIYQDIVGREKAPRREQIKISVPSVDFDEMPLEEVVEWFRDTTDVNFNVNWNSLETGGVDRNTRVSLKLQNVSPGRVLDLALTNAGASAGGYGGTIKLDYIIEGGVVEISTREQLSERMITRVYDVADLLMPIGDKRGGSGFAPGGGGSGGGGTGTSNRGGAGTGGGGRGTSGGTGAGNTGYGRTGTGASVGVGRTGNTGTSFKTKEEIANEFIDMITNIESDSWQKNGGKGTISIFNNKLIVSNNYFVHEKLGSSRIR